MSGKPRMWHAHSPLVWEPVSWGRWRLLAVAEPAPPERLRESTASGWSCSGSQPIRDGTPSMATPAEVLVHRPSLCTLASAGGLPAGSDPPGSLEQCTCGCRAPGASGGRRGLTGETTGRCSWISDPAILPSGLQGCLSAAPQRGPGRRIRPFLSEPSYFLSCPQLFCGGIRAVCAVSGGLIMWFPRASHRAMLRSWDWPPGPSCFGGTSVLVLLELQGSSRACTLAGAWRGREHVSGQEDRWPKSGSWQKARKGRPP